MIFQQFNLVRRASVLTNVLAGRLGYVLPLPSLLGRFPAADRAVARECLAQVGLADFADRRADSLSGGEQQRVAIARALAQAPSVILGDEPTASLDPQLSSTIMGILRRINQERGLTLVVSQHQLATALEYGSRVVGFRAGRICFDGRPDQITPAVVDAIYGDEAPV
jgi:phosphonate transport system ATP-binding protein